MVAKTPATLLYPLSIQRQQLYCAALIATHVDGLPSIEAQLCWTTSMKTALSAMTRILHSNTAASQNASWPYSPHRTRRTQTQPPSPMLTTQFTADTLSLVSIHCFILFYLPMYANAGSTRIRRTYYTVPAARFTACMHSIDHLYAHARRHTSTDNECMTMAFDAFRTA